MSTNWNTSSFDLSPIADSVGPFPGRAWLQFESSDETPDAAGAPSSRLVQTAFFAPKGLAGLLYWYLLYPVHAVIFDRLADRIVERAQG